MTVITNRFVGRHVRVLLIEQRDRRPMKIREVAVKNIGRNVVLRHQLFVGVALGAQLRRPHTEQVGSRVIDIMYTVTINTGWHIRITIGCK